MWTLSLENPCILYIYFRPCPLPSLHLTVINGGAQGSNKAALKEFQSLGPPRLHCLCAAPALASFYSLILAPGLYLPCLLSPRSLSIYLRKGLSQLVRLPPSCRPSTRASLVCLSSVEVSFLSELRWKDCFSCVYTKTTRPPFSQNRSGLVRLCAVQQVPT